MLRGLTDNETRMQAIGFTPYPYRLTAYVIAGTICGLAGFLLGNQAEFVSPAYMHWQRSGELIMMVLLGGTGTLYGPIARARWPFLVLEEDPVAPHRALEGRFSGRLLVLTVLFASGGIAGAIAACRQRRRASRGAVTLPAGRHLLGAGLERSGSGAARAGGFSATAARSSNGAPTR